MARELKIWLYDRQQVIAKLTALGGEHLNDTSSIHTYFNQPDGQVLKLVEMNGAITLDILKRQGKNFVIVSQEPVENQAAMLEKLKNQYGIKTKLTMHSKSYQLQGYKIGLYDIENVGEFLILTGDNPTVELLDKWFAIKLPKVVTVSFDNL